MSTNFSALISQAIKAKPYILPQHYYHHNHHPQNPKQVSITTIRMIYNKVFPEDLPVYSIVGDFLTTQTVIFSRSLLTIRFAYLSQSGPSFSRNYFFSCPSSKYCEQCERCFFASQVLQNGR